MRRFRLVFAVLAAVSGIGGAFASSQAKVHSSSNLTLHWYTTKGTLATTGTINAVKAKGLCIIGSALTCLKGTLNNVTLGTIQGIYHKR